MYSTEILIKIFTRIEEKFTTLPDDALLLVSDNLIQKNLEAYKELAK